MFELKNQNILVYGTGLAGTSAVSFLLKNGANVFVYDDNNQNAIENTTHLDSLSNVSSLDIKLCVVSPGVEILENNNIQILKQNNVEIVSEFSFGFSMVKGKTICVTGTNGKTTTVNLLYDIFKTHKRDVFLCGNTNVPITSICDKTTSKSIVICEVSSFALETARNFKPHIATILNIAADHLNRHKNMDTYTQEKLKITALQDDKDIFAVKKEEDYPTKAQKIYYSTKDDNVNGAYVLGGYIYFGKKKIIGIDKIKLLGEFNLQNVLCAITIAKTCGVKNKNIKKAIENFKPLKHRLEFVRSLHGVSYVNDSKSTNPDSTIKALSAFNKPIILLLGGSKKNLEFAPIFEHLQNVKQIIAFGESGNIIKKQAQNCEFEPIITTKQMVEAVKLAHDMAQADDVVLLSPACASFDEFSSYKHRGEVFIDYVKELK